MELIDSGKKSAKANMDKDASLLATLESSAICHLYDWENDAATYGHFIEPSKFFNMENVEKLSLDIAVRPTGGGIVFHISDFAFSILIPEGHKSFSLNPLENYYTINEKVSCIVKELLGFNIDLLTTPPDHEKPGFCMARPTKYDLIWKGKKVGGAAQRKTKKGFLHQGSILLGNIGESYLRDILRDQHIVELMKHNSVPLIRDSLSKEELVEVRNNLKKLFIEAFV